MFPHGGAPRSTRREFLAQSGAALAVAALPAAADEPAGTPCADRRRPARAVRHLAQALAHRKSSRRMAYSGPAPTRQGGAYAGMPRRS